MPEKARFIIDLDLETLQETAEILQRMDAGFDPVESMIFLPADHLREAIFTGRDMDGALAEVNRYLTQEGNARQLREEFWDMPAGTRRDLMELVTLHMDWMDSMVLNHLEADQLERFAENHPEAMA